MKRIEYLRRFFAALRITDIEITSQKDELVSGRIYYDRTEPDEYQDFCWHIKENEISNEHIFQLADILAENNLVDIDKIIISRE